MTVQLFILENYGIKPNRDFAIEVNNKFGTNYDGETVRGIYRRLNKGGGMTARKKTPPKAGEMLATDRKIEKLSESEKIAKKKLDVAKKQLDKAERERDAIVQIQDISSFEIKPKTRTGESESVAVVLASDWHVGENVNLHAVNGLNEFNLDIARARTVSFFQNTLRLVEILQKDTKIDTLVIALLGDFISGNIHEDIAENTNLGTVDELMFAESLIVSGIEFLLANSKLNLIVPCHSGNHGRATKEQRYATENENSFEYYMYHTIANHFRGEKRVKFLISPSYVSYLEIMGTTIRFHHGHGMKYGGGVGGLFVPTYKAIARMNDGRRADLDCFGHFHQFRDGGSFICNGSLIGHNAYANGKGLGFEKPKQVLFLIERSRGRTFTVPILFSK